MRVIITGGTGFIGSRLAGSLLAGDHEVVVLSRTPAKHQGELPAAVRVEQWDAKSGKGWSQHIDGQTVIVNLAAAPIEGGAFIPKRWTASRRRGILESRVNAGLAVVSAIENAASKPRVVIQSSAVGYYGFHGDEVITESDPPGTDFLSDVCVQWEASTVDVEKLGVRRAIIRTGLPLSLEEGVLPRLVLPFKLFAGGPMGSGKQWYPWLHIDDEIGAIRFLIDNDGMSGPFNLAAPNPVTNKEFAKTLGRVMGRPSWMPVPGPALKIALGEVANLALKGQRVIPDALMKAGYEFKFPYLEQALRDLLVQSKA